MTYDFRDGGSISFQPKPRTTTAWARTLALLIVVGAVAFAVQSYNDDRARYPALAGGANASGIFEGLIAGADGDHAVVSFIPVDTVATATSIDTVDDVDETVVGRAFKVYYVPADTSQTFIEDIDEVAIDWKNQALAGGALLLGLILMIIPFKVRTRTRRRAPSRRHAD